MSTESAAGIPSPGELGIKEQRSWRTWQLVIAAGVASVFGMLIGSVFAGGGSGASTTAGTKTNSALPPESSAGGGTAPTPSTSSPSTPSSTVPSTTNPSTAPGSGSPATTAASATGPLAVLLGPEQSQGNWTSTPFTITTGLWNIGWAFRCSPAPSAGESFQVFVVPASGTPGSTPAVNETGASGQSVTSQSSLGSQKIMVQAPGNCIWAVKVTGLS